MVIIGSLKESFRSFLGVGDCFGASIHTTHQCLQTHVKLSVTPVMQQIKPGTVGILMKPVEISIGYVTMGGRKNSPDDGIAFINILLRAGYQVIGKWFNGFFFSMTKTINLGMLRSCYRFEHSPRKTILILTRDFCSTQYGSVGWSLHKFVYIVFSAFIRIYSALWFSPYPSGIEKIVLIKIG